MSKRGDDSVGNCIRCPSFSTIIKQVHTSTPSKLFETVGEIVYTDVLTSRELKVLLFSI